MKDLDQSLSQLIFYIIFHFKVCVGVSHGVKNSNPGYEGHTLLPGTKDYKVCFFCFRRQFVGLLTLPSSRLTSVSSSFRLLFASLLQ